MPTHLFCFNKFFCCLDFFKQFNDSASFRLVAFSKLKMDKYIPAHAASIRRECSYMKPILTTVIVALLVCSLFYVNATVYGATSYSGVINSNTTWTKANSPYTLTGSVTVDNSATLTIEPGVTINIPSDCWLQVNGVLVAKGTSDQKINIQGGEIHFEGASSGSIIENSKLDSTNLVISSSPTISSSYIVGRASDTSSAAITITGGAPTISDNQIFGADMQRSIYILGGSPTITSNGIIGLIISEGASAGAIVISHNTIEGGVSIQSSGTPVVTNNLVTGFRYVDFNGNIDALINRVSDENLGSGIVFAGDYSNALHDAVVTDNVITGSVSGMSVHAGGTATVERNLITNTSREAMYVGQDAIIKDNTFRNNAKGLIYSNMPSLTITGNNFENNGQYNIYTHGGNVDAGGNWWGTTDTQTIENSIYDYTFDSALGNVSTNPILTAPNSAAQPNSMSFPYINMPTSGGDSNPFHIGTNSTVTDVVFDPDNATLSFTVSGPSGTAGSANVTIAKSVMPNGGALKVYMDDKQISYQLGDDGNSWNLGFAYTHSTHRVTITDTVNQTQPTPTSTPTSTALDEYQVAAVAIAVIALVSVSLVIVFVKKKKPDL